MCCTLNHLSCVLTLVQGSRRTLEALAIDEDAADDTADTSCGVLEEGQAEEVYIVQEDDASAGRSDSGDAESKKTSIDL